jgi:hypothetical protein
MVILIPFSPLFNLQDEEKDQSITNQNRHEEDVKGMPLST